MNFLGSTPWLLMKVKQWRFSFPLGGTLLLDREKFSFFSDFLSWYPLSLPQSITIHLCGTFSSSGRLQIWPKHLFSQPPFLYSGTFSIIHSKISDLIDDISKITASYILANPPWGYFGIRVFEYAPDNTNPIYSLALIHIYLRCFILRRQTFCCSLHYGKVTNKNRRKVSRNRIFIKILSLKQQQDIYLQPC